MQHRSPRPFTSDLGRARKLIEARRPPGDAAILIETEIALGLIGPEILARDLSARTSAHASTRNLSAFEATEVFACALHRSVSSFAYAQGIKPPVSAKYDLRFATRVTFNELWQGRQVIDELGVSPSFYTNAAIAYWASKGNKRVPRTSQLFAPDVIAHVIESSAARSADIAE